MVERNPFNNHETLFLGVTPHKSFSIQGAGKDVQTEFILNKIIESIGTYPHHWQEGDLVIWDNVSVIHKAEGAYTGDRLLLRSQARLHLADYEAEMLKQKQIEKEKLERARELLALEEFKENEEKNRDVQRKKQAIKDEQER